MHYRRLMSAVVGLFGLGLLTLVPATANADTINTARVCRCATANVTALAMPVDPPLTLPFERPDGGYYGQTGIDWPAAA